MTTWTVALGPEEFIQISNVSRTFRRNDGLTEVLTIDCDRERMAALVRSDRPQFIRRANKLSRTASRRRRTHSR